METTRQQPAAAEPEAGLVARLRRGDREAFGQIFEEHRLIVYRMAYRILGNHDGADEATQLAFVKAWRAIGGFRADASLRTWLVRIVLNVAKSMRRAPLRLVEFERAGEPAAQGRAPDAATAVEEDRRLVRRAVDRLPPRQREVVRLKVFGEMTYAEVATVMGLSEGSVKAHLHQAVGNLRKHLAGGEIAGPKRQRG